MSQMLKSSGAMGIATMTSRIFGMVREMVYASFMGDGWVASAFVVAQTIPNLFRRLLGEGALTAAFIPIFKEKEKKEGDREMWRCANAVISGMCVAAVAIMILVLFGISIALCFPRFDEETKLMLRLLRWMFPYMLTACLTAIFMGMLNARGHFFIPAFGSTVLNLVMIASVWWLTPLFGKELQTQIFGLAVGLLIAGVIQAAFQLPSLRKEGFRYAWETPWNNPVVKEVVQKMVPGALGVAAFQINVILTQGIGFWVDPQINASYNYAVRLMELPQGVFGISLATYLLPTLSGMAAEKKYAEFRSTLNQGLGYISYINLLASVLLIVLAEPIMRLLFERGAFNAGSTERASFALACLAPSLLAYSIVNILARAFYALGDTKVPMQISIVCLILNLIFTIPLLLSFKQGGFGMANTLSSFFNVYLLFHALKRKLSRLDLTEFRRHLIRMFGTALVAAQVAWISCTLWTRWIGHDNIWEKIGEVFLPIFLASGTYFFLTSLLRIPEAHELLVMIKKKLRLK